ncbi:hypothetical protein STRIP9103_00232, partial [Streptomyces ipomoeae 91-03]
APVVLAAQYADGDEVFQEGGWFLLRAGELVVQAVLNGQRDVQTDRVEECEGAHGVAVAVLDGGIRGLDVGAGALQQIDRRAEVGEEEAVDYEAGAIRTGDRGLAQTGGEGLGAGEHVVGGDVGAHQFDESQYGRRVEEVHAHDIGGASGGFRAGCHGQAGSGGRQDGFWSGHRAEPGEEGALDVEVFRHRFDDQIAVRGCLHGRGRGERCQGRGLLLGGDPASADGAGQGFGDRREGGFGLLPAARHQHGGMTCGRRDLRDTAGHDA